MVQGFGMALMADTWTYDRGIYAMERACWQPARLLLPERVVINRMQPSGSMYLNNIWP